MKNGRWYVGIGLVIVLIALIFCLNQDGGPPTPGEKHFKVGVFEVVRHPVLDGMADTFRETLEGDFPGRVEFVTMVPEGDAAKTEQMARKFATEGYDLVFVIGTNQAQSLMKKADSLPIVLGAATDPQSAGLVDSWEQPGHNVTGTSDLSPIISQLDRLAEVLPNAKRIGIIYNPSEDNSEIIAGRFKIECQERGLTPVVATISNQNEIKQTLVSLVGKVDALYAPTDATIQSAFPLLVRTANEVEIPVFNCDEGTAKQGAIFSVGFNYDDLGRISAEMAAVILNGKKRPAEMPIRQADRFELYYNSRQIEEFGLAVPETWKQEGKQVGE